MKATKQAVLELRSDGTVAALSSDGATIYTVRFSPTLSCSCKGFSSHGHCYHATQAWEHFGATYRIQQRAAVAEAIALLYAA